jgi:hypothetical protein
VKRVEVRQQRHHATVVVDDRKRASALVDHAVDRVGERRRFPNGRDGSRELVCTGGLDGLGHDRPVDQAHEASAIVHDDGHDGRLLYETPPEHVGHHLGVDGNGEATHGVAHARVADEANIG